MIKRPIWHLGSLSGWRQAGKNWSGCDMLYTSTSLKCITFWHQLELQQTVPREKWQTLIPVKDFWLEPPSPVSGSHKQMALVYIDPTDQTF